jgi:hypothetical protein
MSDLDGKVGIPAMMGFALWSESELALDIVQIGRAGLDPAESCTLTMTGRWFAYEVRIDGGWVFVGVESMDSADGVERLFRVADTTNGWETVQRFCMALESSGLRSLQPRPLDICLDSEGGGFVLG